MLGRPRQSRARGLGRAILDTIPIVKFGEKEPPKPTDVELASTSDTRDVGGVSKDSAPAGADAPSKNITQVDELPQDATQAAVEDHQEGIAPAQPLAAGAAVGTDGTVHDEHLGCSICTEDFEKGQDLRVLPCDHKFHPECVDPWLLNVSGTCPLWSVLLTILVESSLLTMLSRVDLRPVTSHESSAAPDADDIAPSPAVDVSHRRRSAFRDILSLRHRPNASAEERIIALRRLREQQRNRSGHVLEVEAGASVADDVTNTRDRRSQRMSVRLSDVFTGRSRRDRHEGSPMQPGESRGTEVPPPPRDGSSSREAATDVHDSH